MLLSDNEYSSLSEEAPVDANDNVDLYRQFIIKICVCIWFIILCVVIFGGFIVFLITFAYHNNNKTLDIIEKINK